jgi:predicted enzyme related to lactoylglutathione lyase
MSRVVHFEIHAENPERAIAFYRNIFGWEFTPWGGGEQEYWLVVTGSDNEPGINGGMVRRRGVIDGEAVIAYVCTVEVNSIEGVEKAVIQNGGTIALPRMPIPGVGWLFYAKDTEGNIFGVTQTDPNAS